MVDCLACPHHRARIEAPGFVECKAPMETAAILPAFYTYFQNGRVEDPFEVTRRPGVSAEAGAWPLQFRPDSLAFCAVWAHAHPTAVITKPDGGTQ